MLTVPLVTDTDNYPILREEVEAAVKSLEKRKSPGIDNTPGELAQAGGDAVISAFLNTQQLSLGFSGSLLPRPSRDTLREGGMGQEKLTIVFNVLAG